MIDVICAAGAISLLQSVLSNTPQSSSIVFTIIGIVFFALFDLLFWYMVVCDIASTVKTWRMINLRRDGVTVEARILSQENFRRKGGSRVYNVKYSYTYQGKTYTSKQSVSKDAYAGLTVGNTVSALCSPPHPKVALLDGPASEEMIGTFKPALIGTLIASIIFLPFALFFLMIVVSTIFSAL